MEVITDILELLYQSTISLHQDIRFLTDNSDEYQGEIDNIYQGFFFTFHLFFSLYSLEITVTKVVKEEKNLLPNQPLSEKQDRERRT